MAFFIAFFQKSDIITIQLGEEFQVEEKEKLVARYIIFKCLDKGFRINTAKLSFLLMISQGYMLASTGKELFSEDIIIPIVGRLELKNIEKEFIDGIAGFNDKSQYENAKEMISENAKEIIDDIICNYGYFELESLQSNIVLRHLKEKYKKPNKETIISKEA